MELQQLLNELKEEMGYVSQSITTAMVDNNKIDYYTASGYKSCLLRTIKKIEIIVENNNVSA